MAAETTIDALAGAVAPVDGADGIVPVVIHQRETLAERLSELEKFLEYGGKYGFQHSRDEVVAARTKILREHFQENPLAGRVFRSEDSYTSRIKTVFEKHESLWSRYISPRHDADSDRKTRETISSMNLVGLNPIKPIEAKNLLTEGKRKNTYKRMIAGAVTFAGVGAVGLMSAYNEPLLAPKTLGEALSYPVAIGCIGAVGLPLITQYQFFNRIIHSKPTLERAAANTDNYLRSLELISREQL